MEPSRPDSHDPQDPATASDSGGTGGEISALTRVGEVHLTVADLTRSVEYYTSVLGLDLIQSEDQRASLGVEGGELVVLVEEAGAHPADKYTGLFHFALRLPQRVDLARILVHIGHERLVGLSDHFVSEAIYLSDPDGHGIEIYWDRPKNIWEGLVAERMTTLPLAVDDLLSELQRLPSADYLGLPAGTTMGHIHLKVSSIPETIAFYQGVMGFDLMARLGTQAAFLSAGGYHHHIGANSWQSSGSPPPPPGSAALRHATIVFPDETARERILARLQQNNHAVEVGRDGPFVTDPSGNKLLLAVERTA